MNWLEVALSVTASALAAYGGVRAGLARVMERATNAQRTAERAHERIDEMLLNR